MKRYGWTSFYLDTTRGVLQDEKLSNHIKGDLRVTAMGEVGTEFGLFQKEEKFQRWISLRVPDLCTPVEYLELMHEVESAFVQGGLYPALTGACCLGERILNHLLLRVRKHKKSHRRYKEIWKKDSIDDWGQALDILYEWKTLIREEKQSFQQLLRLRNPAVHFGSVAERETKLFQAIQLEYSITDSLFGRAHHRYFWAHGEIYVKQEFESDPLTVEFVIPHCLKVGYAHAIENVEVGRRIEMVVSDPLQYEDRQITDDEFRILRENFKPNSVSLEQG